MNLYNMHSSSETELQQGAGASLSPLRRPFASCRLPSRLKCGAPAARSLSGSSLCSSRFRWLQLNLKLKLNAPRILVFASLTVLRVVVRSLCFCPQSLQLL